MRYASIDLEPLVAGTVRRDGDTVTVSLADRLVRVTGKPELAVAVLADCDGHTPVGALVARYGESAAELVTLLLARGALVEGFEAWRVFHPQGSAGTALGRTVDPMTLASLARTRYRPPLANDEDALALEPIPGTIVPTLGAARRSTRAQDAAHETTYEQISTVLMATHRLVEGASDGVTRGTAPS